MSRPRSARPGSPQPLGDFLPQFLQKSGLSAKVEAASVVPEWPHLVGAGIAAVTEPQRVSEGVLIVAVTTSAWMMELNLMKADILKRVNAGKKEGRIRELVFVMKG